MIPAAPALGPITMCSDSITVSMPASSASTAIRTSAPRSRGLTSVQFSLRTRTIRGGVLTDGILGRRTEIGRAALARVVGQQRDEHEGGRDGERYQLDPEHC